MSILSKKLLAAGLLTAGATLFAGVPTAFAAPLPDPEPVPVLPEPVPAGPGLEAPEPVPPADGEIRVSAPEVGVDGGEATGAPVDAVPNINGDPCVGAWESTVCYAEQQGDSPPEVQPRTSISSSP